MEYRPQFSGARALDALIRRTDNKERAAEWMAIALLACRDDDRYWIASRFAEEGIAPDGALIESALQDATLEELSKLLWSPLADAMSPQAILSLMETSIARTTDLNVLWRLLGAGNDYLRSHPGTIVLPKEATLSVLQSADMNHRIIGLKALVHCDVSFEEFARWVLAALRSPNEDERLGGLCELLEWFREGNEVDLTNAAILANELLKVVNDVSLPDDCHGMKEHAMALIAERVERDTQPPPRPS